MTPLPRPSSTIESSRLVRATIAAVLGFAACASATHAQVSAASGPTGAERTEPDSVVVCGACATVISVKSETRVARKGVGTTASATLDSGVLGDQPDGRGINDTTNAPPGTTSAGLLIPRSDRRLAGSTVWTVLLQRRDGSSTSMQVPDDPALRPGDTVIVENGKISIDKR